MIVRLIIRNIWLISDNAKCWIKIANEWWLVLSVLPSPPSAGLKVTGVWSGISASLPATRWWKFGLKLRWWSYIIITLSVLIINWWKVIWCVLCSLGQIVGSDQPGQSCCLSDLAAPTSSVRGNIREHNQGCPGSRSRLLFAMAEYSTESIRGRGRHDKAFLHEF